MNRNIDLGSANLEGPPSAEALSHQTWALVYRAGESGMAAGGGIRVGMRHVTEWSTPQVDDPAAVGYTTIQVGDSAPYRAYIEFGAVVGNLEPGAASRPGSRRPRSERRFLREYLPWQNMIEVVVRRGLEPSEEIRITFGDTIGGSPGMRVQPFDESAFTFKVFVDTLGNGRYRALEESPSVAVVAAEPVRLRAVMPSDATVNESTWCLVRAEDRYGNPAPGYRGAVQLTATSGSIEPVESRSFGEADGGVVRIEGIKPVEPGVLILTASGGGMEATTNPVVVGEAPADRLLLWGDLHGHTLNSDGRGTVAEFYDFADRVAGLDVCAVTDHGFLMTDEMWEHSKRVTNAAYDPGRFVTLQAYEWSGMTDVGGDHNVYFLDDDPPIYRSRTLYSPHNEQMYHGPVPQANHVEDLFRSLAPAFRRAEIVAIPHFGGRQAHPAWHDADLERAIEVFSEHGRKYDWMMEFLNRGYRLGIIASSDGHFGNPGYGYLRPSYDWDTQEIGMALVGIQATGRSRREVLLALHERRVYATTGSRTVMEFSADGHPMGSEYETRKPPRFEAKVVGTAPIERLEIKRDGEMVFRARPETEVAGITWRDRAFKPRDRSFYFLHLHQADGHEAISSPIWVN